MRLQEMRLQEMRLQEMRLRLEHLAGYRERNFHRGLKVRTIPTVELICTSLEMSG